MPRSRRTDAIAPTLSMTHTADPDRTAPSPDIAIAAVPGVLDEPGARPVTTYQVGGEHRFLGLPSTEVLHGREVRRAYVLPSPTPLDVWRRHLEIVSSTLDAAGVGFFAVPGGDHLVPVLAVAATERARACEALARLCLTTGGVLSVPEATFLASETGRQPPVWPASLSEARILRASWLWTEQTGRLVFGGEYGCDIEFWEDTGDGYLLAPRHNRVIPYARIDTAPTNAPGRLFTALAQAPHISLPTVPTRSEFAHLPPDHVGFPIDAVFTWVDGADPEWRRRRQSSGNAAYHGEATCSARFLNRDELRYSLRSLHMHAPWIRTVHIVTDRQVPDWLDTTHPRVRVVDHREIFTDASMLPTFNSHAIESQLHHIDGLSEHFMYLNDDMFLGRPVPPRMFFEPNGISRFFPAETRVPLTPVSIVDSPPNAAAKNNRALLEAGFGRTVTRMLKHVPYALQRSVLAEIEREYPAEHKGTAASRFRDIADISIPSALHHYYAYFTGRALPGEVRDTYLQLDAPDLAERLAGLLRDRMSTDTFCLNDSRSTDGDLAAQQTLLHGFLESYFPVRSPFEADTA